MTEFLDAMEDGIKKGWMWIILAILVYFLWKYGLIVGFIKGLLPIAGAIVLGRIAWIMWLHYIRQDFISGIDFVLLEIVPPRDVLRSPKAMELFITNALYHFSFKGGKEAYWQGAVWLWFSLEIASIDGQVHFYVRTPTRIRGLIETQMYAQYPQAQIKEVEDYTLAVDEISEQSEWNGYGCEWGLLKPEAYPIKTYIDYELDKDPKEEYKVDPISPLIELFGSMQKGEQMWSQIVVTPSKKEYKTKGTWFGHHDWARESRLVILDMLEPYTNIRERANAPGTFGAEIRIPKFLDLTVEKMGKKTSKLGFDTGMRAMYIAKKETYNPSNRRNLRMIYRQYTTPDANGLNRINSSQADAYSGVFLASDKLVMKLTNRMLNEYRERMFFHPPLRHHIFSKHNWDWPFPGIFVFAGMIHAYFHHQTFVLNVEELATLWHFPGQILKVPTLERIESKEASPPTNLPT
jgi:hypothetical protein